MMKTGANSHRIRQLYGNYQSKSIKEAIKVMPAKTITDQVTNEMDEEVKKIT